MTSADRALAEDLSQHAYGTSIYTRQRTTQGSVPTAYINDAMRIIARPSIVAALIAWKKADRARTATKRPYGDAPGWTPTVSVVTLLVLMLIHVQEGRGVLFSDMATTLTRRMNKKQFAAIGIERMEGTHEQWMDRLFHAKRRLEKMIDPLPGNRRKTPTAEDYRAIVEDREDREEELKEKEDDCITSSTSSSTARCGSSARTSLTDIWGMSPSMARRYACRDRPAYRGRFSTPFWRTTRNRRSNWQMQT